VGPGGLFGAGAPGHVAPVSARVSLPWSSG
jgi:hypothetical protein